MTATQAFITWAYPIALLVVGVVLMTKAAIEKGDSPAGFLIGLLVCGFASWGVAINITIAVKGPL